MCGGNVCICVRIVIVVYLNVYVCSPIVEIALIYIKNMLNVGNNRFRCNTYKFYLKI